MLIFMCFRDVIQFNVVNRNYRGVVVGGRGGSVGWFAPSSPKPAHHTQHFKAHTSRIHTSISLDIIGHLRLPHKKVCGAFGATIRNLTITDSKVTHFSSNVFACMDSMANIKIQNSNVTTGIGGST